MIYPEITGRHRDIQNTEIGTMLDARGYGGGAIYGADGAEPECFELIEQKLHVRRHVVGDEDQRGLLFGVHSNATDAPAARS